MDLEYAHTRVGQQVRAFLNEIEVFLLFQEQQL